MPAVLCPGHGRRPDWLRSPIARRRQLTPSFSDCSGQMMTLSWQPGRDYETTVAAVMAAWYFGEFVRPWLEKPDETQWYGFHCSHWSQLRHIYQTTRVVTKLTRIRNTESPRYISGWVCDLPKRHCLDVSRSGCRGVQARWGARRHAEERERTTEDARRRVAIRLRILLFIYRFTVSTGWQASNCNDD